MLARWNDWHLGWRDLGQVNWLDLHFHAVYPWLPKSKNTYAIQWFALQQSVQSSELMSLIIKKTRGEKWCAPVGVWTARGSLQLSQAMQVWRGKLGGLHEKLQQPDSDISLLVKNAFMKSCTKHYRWSEALKLEEWVQYNCHSHSFCILLYLHCIVQIHIEF